MRIDAYTHFFPKKFFDRMMEIAGDYKDMGKRVRSLPALYDLDSSQEDRRRSQGLSQILSYPQPPFESLRKTPTQIDEMCEAHQRRLRRAVREGARPLSGLGGAGGTRRRRTPARARPSARSRTGALGVQIYTNVARQADRPAGIRAVLEEDERARQADLDSSGARRRDARLSAGRKEVALRNLVGARLVLRDRLRDGAARVLQDHGRLSEPQDHHPPLRRHRADARRPPRPGLGRDGLAHLGRGLRRRCARA